MENSCNVTLLYNWNEVKELSSYVHKSHTKVAVEKSTSMHKECAHFWSFCSIALDPGFGGTWLFEGFSAVNVRVIFLIGVTQKSRSSGSSSESSSWAEYCVNERVGPFCTDWNFFAWTFYFFSLTFFFFCCNFGLSLVHLGNGQTNFSVTTWLPAEPENVEEPAKNAGGIATTCVDWLGWIYVIGCNIFFLLVKILQKLPVFYFSFRSSFSLKVNLLSCFNNYKFQT